VSLTPEEAEFYPTPAWCVRRLLEAVPLPSGMWMEPCVGEGAIVDAVNGVGGHLVHWVTCDIRPTGRADNVCDYLVHRWREMDVCLMNPPFSKALAFAQKALTHCSYVFMLQRLNWLQQPVSIPERTEWLRTFPPALYVLPERPKFRGRGTDGGGYAWYGWGQDLSPEVRILDSTPDVERKTDELAAQQGHYRGPEQLGLEVT